MPRDIPEVVPENIRLLIEANWGDIKSFASECGLKYSKAHSILCRTRQQTLELIVEHAELFAKAGVQIEVEDKTTGEKKKEPLSADHLTDLLLLRDPEERKEKLTALVKEAGFTSPNHVCTEYGVNSDWIYRQLKTSLDKSQLPSRYIVAKKLKLTVQAFSEEYKNQFAVAS